MRFSPISEARFARLLRYSIFLPVSLLAALASTLVWQVHGLLEAADRVDRSDLTIARANHCLRLLIDMETGLRGYLLTGNREFLEPYDRGSAAIESEWRLVQEAMIAREQIARVEGLIGATEDWRVYARRMIALRQGGALANGLEENREGKRLMDEIRRRTDELIRIGSTLRDERSDSAQRNARAVLVSAIGLSLLLGVVLAAAARAQLKHVTGSYGTALAELRSLTSTLEQKVEERTQALQQANEGLESFAYSVSHDLRAPLRAMQGFAHALREDYGDRLDDTGRDYADRISGAAERMDVLIHDLLEYSRLARVEMELRPVSLQSALEEAMEQMSERIRSKGATVTVEPPLPEVLGHRQTLVQVLANLVSNALKFTAPGVTPRVTVRAEELNGTVRVWVVDNGIGIEPDHFERIFRVFERLHGIDRYPGTGIGLAIVRKGVERMGGRAGVDSQSGEGSRFWFELAKV